MSRPGYHPFNPNAFDLPEADELFLFLPHAEEAMTPARMGRLHLPLDAHPITPPEKPVSSCPIAHHVHKRKRN